MKGYTVSDGYMGYVDGEYLLFLNNDTEVITANWMEELLMYAQREDVGIVGAKLYYSDNTIQHAGIVLGLGAHRAAGCLSPSDHPESKTSNPPGRTASPSVFGPGNADCIGGSLRKHWNALFLRDSG